MPHVPVREAVMGAAEAGSGSPDGKIMHGVSRRTLFIMQSFYLARDVCICLRLPGECSHLAVLLSVYFQLVGGREVGWEGVGCLVLVRCSEVGCLPQ
ncbi:hypothetical protein BaRGS_00028961 [Batillaria attramentaria]|uniref:Uncharacterized protein n=1 Tax=Batillaria attramentaria TaxID=370345 RepID=A0ABD0JXL2_9CAEN